MKYGLRVILVSEDESCQSKFNPKIANKYLQISSNISYICNECKELENSTYILISMIF